LKTAHIQTYSTKTHVKNVPRAQLIQ